jgi:hypothetical protein
MYARMALALGLVAACSGPASHVQPAAPAQAGQGAPACEAVRGKIEQLYRAEAQAQPVRDAKRVDQAVADNTAMVLGECNQAPDKVAGCVRGASTSHDLEARCLAPLDDDGSEGDRVAR